MKLFLFTGILMIASNPVSAQNLTVLYQAEQDVIGAPKDANLSPLPFTGYYFKKGNAIISYIKPEFNYPDGIINLAEYNHVIPVNNDPRQIISYYQLDSFIYRYHIRPIKGIHENIFFYFDPGYFQWEVQEGSYMINGIECRHAIRYSEMNNGVAFEIWYNEDIEMPIGPLNLFNVPGLVVKAKIHGLRTTLTLKEFSTTDVPEDKVFWPKEFNAPFKKQPDLRSK